MAISDLFDEVVARTMLARAPAALAFGAHGRQAGGTVLVAAALVLGAGALRSTAHAATSLRGAAEEMVFADDFESGNTSAWSFTEGAALIPLLVTEIASQPTAAEYIEIFNPNVVTMALDNVYLADYADYYQVTIGGAAPGLGDFRIRFPAGTNIAATEYVVVSLESASDFFDQYGFLPDFDLHAPDNLAPAMLGEFDSNSGLTNGDEMLVLFEWDGGSDLVADLDYVLYGNSSDAMDKTGVTVGTSTYANETAAASQDFGEAPADGSSLQRCDLNEGFETKSGGNGLTGHDETSENLATTFQTTLSPNPGAPSLCL